MSPQALAFQIEEALRRAYLEREQRAYFREQFDSFGAGTEVDPALRTLVEGGKLSLRVLVRCENGHDMGEYAPSEVGHALEQRCPRCDEPAAEGVFLKFEVTPTWANVLRDELKKKSPRMCHA